MGELESEPPGERRAPLSSLCMATKLGGADGLDAPLTLVFLVKGVLCLWPLLRGVESGVPMRIDIDRRGVLGVLGALGVLGLDSRLAP